MFVSLRKQIKKACLQSFREKKIMLLSLFFVSTISSQNILADGGWGNWSDWSPCSVTCGNGSQRRHRFCNNPAPDNGGLDCPGNATEHSICKMDECRGIYMYS